VAGVSAAGLAFDLALAAICVLWIAGAVVGMRVLLDVPVPSRLGRTGRLPPPAGRTDAGRDGERLPLLSILVPASNEAGDEGSIADLRTAHAGRLAAAESLAAAGPGLTTEIVYLDDRSTDTTGAVLDAFARPASPPASPPSAATSAATTGSSVAVRTLHIRELPAGWLGKTHALDRGIADSRGEWVLMTDADVRLSPDALRLALGHARQRGLDHLVLAPQLDAGGLLRDATLAAFGRLFALNLAAVNDPSSNASVGVGAFNLVRRSALARIGGMRSVRLDVGDDLALGAALRRSGAAQGVASGRDLVQLAWYRTTGQIVRGLEKGLFAFGGRCRPWRLYLGALALLVLELAPWVALATGAAGWAGHVADAAATPGAAGAAAAPAWVASALGLLGALAIALGIGVVALGERWMGRRMLPALLVPIGGLVMDWAVLRAGWMGWRRGGVLWRGTLYPSALLRQAMGAGDAGGRAGR